MNNNIEDKILKLAYISRDNKEGVTRLLYTKQWKDSIDFLRKWLEEANFKVYYDCVGNMYGRIEGVSQETIVIGSHIDSVVNGGAYDGTAGIIIGFEAIKNLIKKLGRPKKNIELVAFCDEEGTRFNYPFIGVKCFLGYPNYFELENLVDNDGISFFNSLEKIGFNKFSKEEYLNNKHESVSKYFEIHVEQSRELEMNKKTIGIVETITGKRKVKVTINGQANHAGTTPQHMRKDALVGASQLVLNINENAKKYANGIVATVGLLNVSPNVPNVVPGAVEMIVDIRHFNIECMENFIYDIKCFSKEIREKNGLEISFSIIESENPVPLDKELFCLIEKTCIEKEHEYMHINSFAGHDAMLVAQNIPSALIFLPSKDGISHNKQEYTKPQDLEIGAAVIEELIKQTAY